MGYAGFCRRLMPRKFSSFILNIKEKGRREWKNNCVNQCSIEVLTIGDNARGMRAGCVRDGRGMCVPMRARCVYQWARDVCTNGRGMCVPMGARCVYQWARDACAMGARCVYQWARDVCTNARKMCVPMGARCVCDGCANGRKFSSLIWLHLLKGG
jgi:hypothetical protein